MSDDKHKQLEQERNELNRLIGNGASFEVKDVEFVREKGFFGLFSKKVRKDVTRKFTIKEMTLATLDRLSLEWVEFALDDDRLEKDAMPAARGLVRDHAERCARVIAIAVLDEDRLIAKPGKHGQTRWVENETEVKRLTDLFMRTIRPSGLRQLVRLVEVVGNLGDFTNSIRLMSVQRTSVPLRIEGDNQA